MSSSDSGSPTAARMLMSLQRLESGCLLGAAAFSTSAVGGDGGAATATACGLGLALGRGAATGAGLGSTGAVAGAGSRGTAADRHGVRHGFVSAAAGMAPAHSAITIAIGAMAENGEDRGG
ncbi:hypothetical protein [Variovorax paradoxus]|uniref:hypothetical protein n=1 Tax=Variovorax paradoxus TaxID=34073 RepID=UPI00277D5E49|nr:hypothetical protein [Variovorax paradoxus]MDQ0590066.1 hypothetical protein [Variovorax paradoxus]